MNIVVKPNSFEVQLMRKDYKLKVLDPHTFKKTIHPCLTGFLQKESSRILGKQGRDSRITL
jgi:hypothetical protein